MIIILKDQYRQMNQRYHVLVTVQDVIEVLLSTALLLVEEPLFGREQSLINAKIMTISSYVIAGSVQIQ